MVSTAATKPFTLTSHVVNVASVPQRSAFRYPGGKTWLVPYIRLWLRSSPNPIKLLVEPFAGGAIVGLTAAFEALADRVLLVELDTDVSAVWKTILGRNNTWLAQRIKNFELKPETVRLILSSRHRSTRERAFATILRNRVQRGGIMAPGAGLMKNGENGKGLSSRWYPETLSKRITDIRALRGIIKFHKDDGLKFIKKNLHRKDAVFFIDPPYTIAGRRLYRHPDIDHRELFNLMRRSAADFLMTYDDSKEIRDLIIEFRFDCETVAMKNTHNAKIDELLIGRNLNWLRRAPASQQPSLGFAPQTLPG